MNINVFLSAWQDFKPSPELRSRILAGIAPKTQLVMRQLRLAQSFAMMLLLASLSLYISADNASASLGLLDIPTITFTDSVVMESYQLSNDVVLESIVVSD